MMWRGMDLGHVTMTTLAKRGRSGRHWYRDSQQSIAAYADRHGFDVGVVVDTLAILSPRVTVGFSVELAHEWLTTGKAPRAMRARTAALRRYATTGTFGGPKVNAFSQALRGDPDAVVVDAWMFRAARESRTTPAAYRAVAHAVRQAGDGLGWHHAETQAAIWQGAREHVGYHVDGYAPLTMEGL